MRSLLGLLLVAGTCAGCGTASIRNDAVPKTVCNPMDLSYRFMPELPSRREAADPTVILFKDRYYLFASMSGGYWWSDDLAEWRFIQTDGIPTEEYAPTAVVLDDTVYFLASSKTKSTVYRSDDPMTGRWTVAKESLEVPVWDPDLFLDDDGRLYLYWGCSNKDPLFGVELDPKDFSFKGKPVELLRSNKDKHGWEVRGDDNRRQEDDPWIEGAWVNKRNGKYYLQYAAPGTLEKSYSDGVYVGNHPLGPYTLAPNNPFACKPGGFACGAGHGCTFEDRHGNFWHVGTVTISVKHKFERRLAMHPTFFDADGILFADTRFGDYPLIVPDRKIDDPDALFPGWMLLSYRKPVRVSSQLDGFPPENCVDEEIRTHWSAKSGMPAEWAAVDLGSVCTIHAVQIDFAEHDTRILGRKEGIRHRYVVEVSMDGKDWTVLADRSSNDTDNSHAYIQLKTPARSRHLRIRNVEVPDGCFALSGLRVFGLGDGDRPGTVQGICASRDPNDRRSVALSWQVQEDAEGYLIRFGTEKEKLYRSCMVHGTSQASINSLHADRPYWFTIEAFNGNGVSSSGRAVQAH